MLPFSPSGLYCAFEQSEIIACAAGKGRGPWASWRRRRRRKRKRREHTHTHTKKWQDSNWQINRGGKWDKREKEREKYLCKDNGSTTPLWEQDSCPKRYDHITWHTYFTVNVWTAESWTITARMAGAELFCFYSFNQNRFNASRLWLKVNRIDMPTGRQTGWQRRVDRTQPQEQAQTQTHMDE